jgi:hypothetical protein
VNDKKGHWGLTPLGMGRAGFLMVAPRARADASGSATGAVAALAIAGHHSGVPRFASHGRVPVPFTQNL